MFNEKREGEREKGAGEEASDAIASSRAECAVSAIIIDIVIKK